MTLMRIRPKADLVYGASGTRKTSNIGLIAEYVWKKYSKRTRMITLDGGGFDPLLSLVEAGIIEPWVLIGRTKLTTNVVDLAMQGYWPKEVDDPVSPLVSPTMATWEEIGFYAIEGLTSMGDSFIRILKRDKASLSQDPSYTYSEEAVEVDGKKKVISYSGGNMTYFGFAQDQLYDFVMKTHVLPCEKVLWTALEGKGEEEGTRAPVYGPAIVGRKSTGKATQWFGNSVHIEQLVSEEYDDKTKQTMVIEKPVMYTRTHAGKDKIPFPCKTRAPFQLATQMPAIFDPPDMAALYRKLDELNEKALAEVKKVAMVNIPKDVQSVQSVPSGANGESAADKPADRGMDTPAPAPKAPDQFDDRSVMNVKPMTPVTTVATVAASIATAHAFVPPRISVKKPQ